MSTNTASATVSQTDPMSTKEKAVVSRKFGPETGGDVVFRSSDNVSFHVHQKHLEVYAEGFPLAKHTTPSQNEIIPLSEKSSTLEHLFQFMLPQRPPELDGLDFEQLMALANASEKYVVYSAQSTCALYMRDFLTSHPEQILKYAATYHHNSVIYTLAPQLVMKPLTELANLLPHDVFVPWSIYRSNFHGLLSALGDACAISSTHPQQHKFQEVRWLRKIQQVKDEIKKDPTKLSQFRTLIYQADLAGEKVCECHCCNPFKEWVTKVCGDIGKMEDIKIIARKYLAEKYARG
ncbi:hypothetical protein D9758_013971 [Tetrapyrgos nigripes]|uniref:BTB domain-containing protein n=1 Tax=Tetrapyrgos nigripes TaxID=182062 RepID=A0A8H5G7S0_9AGAR|nr:hypothetical protein D9758_013971 [Tetrapyrgos nigripes]